MSVVFVMSPLCMPQGQPNSFHSGQHVYSAHQGQPQRLPMSDTATSEPTTICFKNIPNFYNRAMVLELLDSNGFKGSYDFVYVPHSFKRLPVLVTLGYFFVNFASHEVALRAWVRFAGFMDWVKHSDKIMDATWATTTQGQKACIERFQNSRVMNNSVPSECRPALFELADIIEGNDNLVKDADAKSDRASSVSTVMTDGSDSETDVGSSDSAVDTDEAESWRPRRCNKASTVVPSLEHCGFVERGMEHSIVVKNTFIDVEESHVTNGGRARCHTCFV